LIPPQEQPPANGWKIISAPDVQWGPMDVMVAATVTMLIVVSMLSLGGAIGTSVGYDTAITNPTGYYIGGLAGVLAFILLRLYRSPVWPMALATVAGGGVIAISYQFATDIGEGPVQFIGVPVAIISATAMSGTFAASAFSFSVILYREPLRALGFVKTVGLRPYVLAAGMWIIGLSVLMFWVQILIWVDIDLLLPPDTAEKALDEAGGSIVITLVLVGLLGPIAEEIFFRGFVLPGLIKRLGVWRALVISSLVFGLFHIDPGAIVPTFALGLALGWVYLKTGSIWPAIFAHGLHNTVAVLVAKYGNIT
jgi:membrane protease YdiL (CAAX protease family)